DAAHPAMDAVARGVRPLLVNAVRYRLRRSAACSPDLVPPGAGNAGRCLDQLVGHQRLVSTEVPISEPKGRPLAVRQDVEELRRVNDSGLRQAVAGRWRT